MGLVPSSVAAPQLLTIVDCVEGETNQSYGETHNIHANNPQVIKWCS